MGLGNTNGVVRWRHKVLTSLRFQRIYMTHLEEIHQMKPVKVPITMSTDTMRLHLTNFSTHLYLAVFRVASLSKR